VRALIDVDVDRDRGAESLGSDSDWANKRESKMPKEALYFFDCATKSSTNSRLRGDQERWIRLVKVWIERCCLKSSRSNKQKVAGNIDRLRLSEAEKAKLYDKN
jgi:hypothetical protein